MYLDKKLKKWDRLVRTPCIPLGKNRKFLTACDEHLELARRAAAEGMVLLKNEDKVLPLEKGTKVAVFGKAQYDYVRGGGGSGCVCVSYVRDLYSGLKIKEEEGKLCVYEGILTQDIGARFFFRRLYDYYVEEMEKQYAAKLVPGQPDEVPIPEDLLQSAKAYTDTAIIAISRYSSEDFDRTSEKGDYYLSDAEEEMVKKVTDNFKKVIVVINSGSQIDTEWFYKNDKISAVLWAWQAGIEGGLAMADVLCGDVNPSGKLVDTFAKTYEDYPSSSSFFDPNYQIKYYEDIYVGYRYFETIPGAKERVIYPFGFGLSYTEFEITDIDAKCSGDKVIVKAIVTNIGELSGKEVVQVYYSAPQGKLGKPACELATFKKTKELAPGESAVVRMEFSVKDMASFDDTGKIAKTAYVLEKGSYKFYVGNSVRNKLKTDYEYVVSEDRVIEQLTPQCVPVDLEKRMVSDGSFEGLEPSVPNTFENNYEPITAKAPEQTTKLMDVVEGKVTLEEFIAQLSDDQLIFLTYGTPNRGIACTHGMGGIDEFGIPAVMTTDGPAGIRAHCVTATCWPCETLLACTWDPDIVREVSEAGAKEVKENNLGIWLAPGMNIHRNPLCGRNFEYYSEDPLITGVMATAAVKGIQSQHIAATIKHFCANNTEVKRPISNSIVSERALREIYLKGFEICVKEAQPWLVMTGYNLVNGVKAFENYDLITGILRGEWGYEGAVTTDWGGGGVDYKFIKAGNDIRMPRGKHEDVAEALRRGDITRAELEVCVKRILELFIKLD